MFAKRGKYRLRGAATLAGSPARGYHSAMRDPTARRAKRPVAFVLCCFLACFAAVPATAIPKVLTCRWAYIDKAGKIVIDGLVSAGRPLGNTMLAEAGSFADGAAVVLASDKSGAALGWFIIGPSGELLFDVGSRCEFDSDTYVFSEGLVPFKDRSAAKFGYTNPKGEIVVPAEFDWGSPFSEGLARVEKNGKCGFIDRKGKVVIPFEFNNAGSFQGGFAVYEKGGRYGYIDGTGKALTPPIYDSARPFSEGLALVKSNGKYGFLGRDGAVAIPCAFEYAESFKEGLAPIRSGEKHGYIDKTGGIAIAPKWDSCWGFSEGLAVVSSDERYGYIDAKGKVAIKLRYRSAWDFSEGLARVETSSNGDYGYIDKRGKLVIDTRFYKAKDFKNGLAAVYAYGAEVEKAAKKRAAGD